MKRLRILHCIYDDTSNPWLGGGGAHRVFEVYRRLAGELDVTVATGAYPGAVDGDREGVRYLHLGASRPYPLSRLTYGLAASRMLGGGAYDAAVFDFSVYTPIRTPRSARVGHVVHMLIGPTAGGRWGRLVGSMVDARERRMLSRAERVETTSRWMAEQLRTRAATGARIEVVGSGVDESFFRVDRQEAGYLLCYGRLDPYHKGLDLLLSAYADLRDRLERPPELVIAGRGDEDRVAGMIRAAGVEGVRLEAPVDRPRVLKLLAGALALLMPSRFEGLPVVPMEAMAAGVPVVAAAVGALDEIVEDGRSGLLIPPEDAPALANAALGLVRDPEARTRLSRSARAAAERFHWDEVAAAHSAWLEGLAGA